MVQIAIKAEGSQKAFARRVGLSESYLSDILNRRREISPRILKFLGLERVVTYQRVDGGQL
jgi:DNA-binding transcriptional regulator YdaS (Cro superfamily)